MQLNSNNSEFVKKNHTIHYSTVLNGKVLSTLFEVFTRNRLLDQLQ